MAGKIFELLPEELLREIRKHITKGIRFRIPPYGSSHDPIYVRDRIVQICKMKQTGTETGEIANNFQLTKQYVRRVLKDNGLADRPTKKKSRKAQLEELLTGGISKKAIAQKLGISRQRLYQIMKEEELK